MNVEGAELRILAKVRLWQAIFNRLLGQIDAADRLVRQSLRLMDDPGLMTEDLRSERAMILLEMGRQIVDVQAAGPYLEASLRLFRDVGDHYGAAQALSVLGHRTHHAGESKIGLKFLADSLALWQELGDRRRMADSLDYLGFYMMLEGQAHQGEAWLRQSLAIRRETGDPVTIAQTLGLLASGLGIYGRFAEARPLAEDQIRLSQEVGHRRMTADACITLAIIITNLGHYGQSRRLASKGLALYREAGDLWGISYVLWQMGDIALAEGAYLEAKKYLQESVDLHYQIGALERVHGVLSSLGYVLYFLQCLDEAWQCLRDALGVAGKRPAFFSILLAIPLAALLLAEMGRLDQALELYALARKYPHIANSRWDGDVVGRKMAEVAASLPEDVVAAARERGAARDIWATVEELLTEFPATHL